MKNTKDRNGSDEQLSVAGTIHSVNGSSLAGLVVEALAIRGNEVIELGSATLAKDGSYRVTYAPPGLAVLNLQIQVIAPGGDVLGRSRVVRNARADLRLDLAVGPAGVIDPQARFSVSGRVAGTGASGVAGLRVDIADRRVGADVVLTSVPTREGGTYAAFFARGALLADGRDRPDLIAKVYSGEELLGQSALFIDAEDGVRIDVPLPKRARKALASEVESLAQELKPHYAGGLADLVEDAERRDITLLARKSGWDARLIAMSAAAARFSGMSAAGGGQAIDPEWFYALFRAGLPADAEALFMNGAGSVESIWKQALEAGVVPARLEKSLRPALTRFTELSAERLLAGAPPAGLSPIGEFLRLSLGDDAAKHERLVQLQVEHATKPEGFWKAVDREFGAEAARLRIDGHLASLTLNNAPLARALHDTARAGRMTDLRELVANGFYKSERWMKTLDGMKIPPEIKGDTPAEQQARYADYLSAAVKLSYPTAVMAAMVKEDAQLLREADGSPARDSTRKAVGDFLTRHQDALFLATQPVEQYIRQQKLDKVDPGTVRELNRLQRVYQVTPNDTSMSVLLREGIDSAYGIVGYTREKFVAAFKDKLAGEAEAALIYAKAEQVHGAVLNLAVSYLGAKNAPPIGVHSPAHIVNPAPNVPNPNTTDVLAYAALEQLFGEMDYCECEHCRSVLSPAAYLVNLLQFLDPPGHPNPTPQRVLFERRPDIQHLPLTCENTNTPLPQIDLVNETLEFFVAADSPVAAPQVVLSLGGFRGNDTPPGTRPEGLLASPSFVRDAAYKILESATFPVSLPFFQPLEALRRYFAKFDAPLPRVMEALRSDDSLERAGTAIQPAYAWRDVFIEELRLSRTEYTLLSDSTQPFADLFGYAPGTAEANVITELAKAKLFAHRIGVSYAELVQVLGTQFVNPGAVLITKLLRLGVPFATLKQLKDGAITDAQFLAAITPQLDVAEYGGNIADWVKDNANYSRIMALLTLADPAANPADADPCNFDRLEFRYALPDNAANAAQGIEYLRLLRFIRLWRKLGWPIELVDQAITALYPPAELPDQPAEATNRLRLDAGFRVLMLRLGIVRRLLTELELDARRDLPALLACCASIGTHGADSLYRRLFVGAEFLRHHPAFADDGYGNFLDDPAGRVLAQREALRGAMQLTDEEFTLVVAKLQFDANTVLDLVNVSRVFRYGWLARKLKLSVAEFIALVDDSAIDPFGALDVAVAGQPVLPGMLRFIRFVADLRAANLKPNAATYLVWNRDLSGKSAPAASSIASFAIALRRDLSGVESEMAIGADPEGTVARERMALVYGIEVTETFFGLLENTFVTQVAYSHPNPALAPAVLAIAPERLIYDDLRKQLSFRGVLLAPLQAQLRAGQSAAFQAAIDGLFAANQSVVTPFFAAFPELRQAFDIYVASVAPLEQRRTQLLATFLPILAQRRSRQLALQAVSVEVRSNVDFASALLARQTNGVYPLHASGDVARPGLDDIVAMGVTGLEARFFFRNTATGAVDVSSSSESELAYSPGNHPLPASVAAPAAPISGIWSGRIEAPETGFYNLRIEADAGAAVTILLAGAVVALNANANQWTNAAPIELAAGQLVSIELTVENTRSMIVRWQTAARAWEVVPPRFLYGEGRLTALTAHYLRVFKAASLQQALALSVAELAHLATAAPTRINNQGWLNALVVAGATPALTVPVLYTALSALLHYAVLRQRHDSAEDRLLEALRDPNGNTAAGQNRVLAVTRWSNSDLTDLLGRFGLVRADLAVPGNLRRVSNAVSWLEKLGIGAATLIASTTNQPDATMVRNLQSALRARYSEADWLNLLQPINDELRTMQRDALVAFILQRMSLDPLAKHIDTPERLFEYFLMDVQMEPCMQTSRVRHALSAVQLFIDRCLMDLEVRVQPGSINAEQWKWMNRYRVWEANRKVFLYPENWLEPELRDDQSPIFKEVMSELLQGDITEERAQVALLGYLARLEEIAKLEPCGLWHEDGAPGTSDDISHVVARTSGASRKYFYRQRAYGSWTPWEQIKLDIEDNPVTPVVWKGRLFLFWLRMTRAMPDRQSTDDSIPANAKDVANEKVAALKNQARSGSADETKMKYNAVLCWSERFNGAWQAVKTSNLANPVLVVLSREEWFDRSRLRLMANEEDGALTVSVHTQGFHLQDTQGRFRLFNTHAMPQVNQPYSFTPWKNQPRRLLKYSSSHLSAEFYTRYAPYTQWHWDHPPKDIKILAAKLPTPIYFEPANATRDPWNDPFLLADSPNAFFVTCQRHDRAILFGGSLVYGNYRLADATQVVDFDLEMEDGSARAANNAARQQVNQKAGRMTMDADPTQGEFLRHTMQGNSTWRYGQVEIDAGGAVTPEESIGIQEYNHG
jgi:hypothetical protein